MEYSQLRENTQLPFSSLRVLIVDDDPLIVDSIAAFLRAMGIECDCADNGFEGTAALSEPYDLLLTDIQMSGNEELEFFKEIRRRYITLPIIVFTGNPSLRPWVEELGLRLVGFLVKPFPLPLLLEKIMRFWWQNYWKEGIMHRLAQDALLKQNALPKFRTSTSPPSLTRN